MDSRALKAERSCAQKGPGYAWISIATSGVALALALFLAVFSSLLTGCSCHSSSVEESSQTALSSNSAESSQSVVSSDNGEKPGAAKRDSQTDSQDAAKPEKAPSADTLNEPARTERGKEGSTVEDGVPSRSNDKSGERRSFDETLSYEDGHSETELPEQEATDESGDKTSSSAGDGNSGDAEPGRNDYQGGGNSSSEQGSGSSENKPTGGSAYTDDIPTELPEL